MATAQPAAPRCVAIVINFNYGRYLRACLESIDHQTYHHVRVLVVDDCSTDDSVDVIQRWAASTSRDVDVLLQPVNRGPSHAYNVALARLTCEDDYVSVIDADDFWHPEKFEHQVRAFETAPAGAVVVYADSEELDDQTGARTTLLGVQAPAAVDLLPTLLTDGSFMPLASTLIRADELRRMAPLDESMRLCDLSMWLRLARRGTFTYAPGPGAVIRKHGSSMSRLENLAGDRLRLLGATPKSPAERRAARRRGRGQLRMALLADPPPPVLAYRQYLRGARDLRTLPYLALRLVPGAHAAVRALRSR